MCSHCDGSDRFLMAMTSTRQRGNETNSIELKNIFLTHSLIFEKIFPVLIKNSFRHNQKKIVKSIIY